MTTLPLKFSRNADIWADNFPETINLQCELDFYTKTSYQRGNQNEEIIKKALAARFRDELYGPIKEKLAEVQCFFMASLSPSADYEKAAKLFEELYAAIPKVNL